MPTTSQLMGVGMPPELAKLLGGTAHAVQSEVDMRTALLAGQPIVISSPITLTSNLAITTQVIFLQGGRIITNGYTCTITGALSAGAYQIFTTSGAEVVFGSASTTFILPQWYGAIGDDSNDDTGAIQSALNAGANRTVIFPKVASKYKITGNINPVSLSHIKGENYPTIHQTSANSVSIEIPPGTTDLIIEGLQFETDGTYNVAYAGRSCIDMNSAGSASYCTNVTIRDCNILITPITGLSCYRATNLRIEKCNVNFSTGEHGIYLLDVDDTTITNNYIVGPGLAGSCIKCGGTARNNTITNNVIEGATSLSYGISIPVQSGTPIGAVISGNIIKNTNVGIYVGGEAVSISNNVIVAPTNNGIEIDSAKKVSCVGNTITGVITAGKYGIAPAGENITVIGNVVIDCPRGMRLGDTSSNMTVANNVVNNTTNAGTHGLGFSAALAARIPVLVYGNLVLGYSSPYYYVDEYSYEWGNFTSATQTLPIKKASVCFKAATVGAGTTAGYMRTNSETYYQTADGSVFNKASTDDVWDLRALTTAAGMYAKVALCGTSGGTYVVVKGAEVNSRNGSKLPWVIGTYAIIGYVQLEPSYSGGALGGAFMSDCVGVQNIP